MRQRTETPKDYVGLFTVESWREFKRHGGEVMGFTDKKVQAAARLQPGDRILCYLTKVSAFVGVMEVTGPSYLDLTPIWSDGLFPVRLPVRMVVEVSLFEAVPIRSLSGKLSFMRGAVSNNGWTIYVRSSPRLWNAKDATAVVKALEGHAANSRRTGTLVPDGGEAKHSAGKAIKAGRFPPNTRVGQIIRKTERLAETEDAEAIGSYGNALSFNKVTGYSVNVPIAATCQPTAVCLKTCYFAVGAPSWSNALRHQAGVYKSIKDNPVAFAERVAMEYDSLGLTFLRWNGGGDLFQESVAAINHLGRARPDIVLWVVTRIPEFAVQIEQLQNVYIHFSLDKNSLSRRAKFLKLGPRSRNYFFSYQCEPGEMPDPQRLGHAAVLFFDNYEPSGSLKRFEKEIVCPLNKKKDISGTCVKCRRCFNGAAVGYEKGVVPAELHQT